MSTTIDTTYTAEELLKMPDGELYELVDGQLVERVSGAYSSWVGGRLVALLGNFVERNSLGWVFSAGVDYQCFPGRPNHVLKPSGSFIRFGRFKNEELPRGHCRIAPDLMAEVISHNDFYSDVIRRVCDFLEAGVELIWVIDPDSRSVMVYRADGSVNLLHEQDQLTGEPVLKDFTCTISELFPPKLNTNDSSADAEQNG